MITDLFFLFNTRNISRTTKYSVNVSTGSVFHIVHLKIHVREIQLLKIIFFCQVDDVCHGLDFFEFFF